MMLRETFLLFLARVRVMMLFLIMIESLVRCDVAYSQVLVPPAGYYFAAQPARLSSSSQEKIAPQVRLL